MNEKLIHSFDQVSESLFSRIGGKGSNLVRLSKAGLPVPAGFCVTDSAHDYFLQKGHLPENFVNDIVDIKRSLGGKVAIRSSANCEDGVTLTMAGVFQSHYVYDDDDIACVVEQIYRQARSDEVGDFMALHGRSREDVKMALVIQELIEPETAGVVYTGVNGNNLLVQYVDDFGASLVDGHTKGSSMIIDRVGRIVESSGFESRPLSASVVNQITEHTKAVEELFPGVSQDIEFAARDQRVYLVQARTLTTDIGNFELEETPEETLEATKLKLKKHADKEKKDFGTNNAIFSDANYSELLPRPTEMDIGIYMYVWGGSDGVPGAKQIGHSQMGYFVPGEAIPVISYFGGRTYFSIARNAALYHIGFPRTKEEYFSTLVQEYLDTVQQDPEKGAYPQMGLYLQDPTFEDLQSRFGDRALEYFQVYQAFSERMSGFTEQFAEEFYKSRLPETTNYINEMQQLDLEGMTNEQLLAHINGILEHVRTYSYVDFVRAARLGFYYSQRLPALLMKKLGMEDEEAKQMYSRLNQGLDGSSITDANIAITEASSDEEAKEIARALIGHFSTGEMLEIRHKPLRDVPDAFNSYIAGIRQSGNYREQFERQKAARVEAHQRLLEELPEQERDKFDHIIRSSQTYMALRETNKYLFTKEYLLLRDGLELLGSRLALQSGDVYFLYPRELPNLIADPSSMAHLIRSRKQAFMNYSELDMPSVIRESDIDNLSLRAEEDIDFTEAKGKFLAEGPQVEGVILNLDDFQTLDEARIAMHGYNQDHIGVILVATQMNLNHDPFIAQASGLVIENAGIVAHGAQRARELGKGAIAGIKSRILKTGTKVVFDPASRIIRRVA